VGHTTQVPHVTNHPILDRTPPAEMTPAERAAAIAALLAPGLLRHLHSDIFQSRLGPQIRRKNQSNRLADATGASVTVHAG
jgi:hypothetical protein